MLEFNTPNITSDTNGATGVFVIEPLERGYGTTLGNSLRRVMLASMPGAAAKYIKIDGVLHEFSTLDGVREDVTEIVLNVKGIVVKLNGVSMGTGHIDFIGPGVVKAGDIVCDPYVEIVNPEHPIAVVADSARFYMELGFGEGRGYVSAEKNKQETADAPIGTIFVDSIFTPVMNVSYAVENTRVGSQTDYDKLTVTVTTNGALLPADAMAIASDIMIKHFECIASLSNVSTKPAMIPDEESRRNAVLETKVEDLEFSVRSFNCLRRAGIDTLGDLVRYTEDEMLRIRNLGQKSFVEIKEKLATMGLSFREE